MQFRLEEERIGQVELESIFNGLQVTLLGRLIVEEGQGIDDGRGKCLAGLASTGKPILHGKLLIDPFPAWLSELSEVLPLLPLNLLLPLLRPPLLLPNLLTTLFSLILPLFDPLDRPLLHLGHLRMELLDEQFRLQWVILRYGVQVLRRKFVLVEEEVILLTLTPIDYVLLQLVLLQAQLLVLEPVIFLPPLVTGKNGLELTGIGSSGSQDHLAPLPSSPLTAVDMSFEDSIDQPPHLGRIGQVQIGHFEYWSLAELPPRAAIGGIAQDLEPGWFIHFQIPIPPSLILLLLIVDLLLALAVGPEILELAIIIAQVEEGLLVGRLALLLTARLDLTGRHVGHHLALDLVVDDLLHVGVVREVLVLLQDVHTVQAMVCGLQIGRDNILDTPEERHL